MHISTNSEKCSGCTACQAICPAGAIAMQPDEEGFLYPVVNEKICVDCGLCVNHCPATQKYDAESTILKTLTAKWENEIREDSASGALFPAIAKYFIEVKQGYVCGCVLENLIPTHIVSNCWSDIRRMQDSKYVQSDMNTCFAQIAQLLGDGKSVLFTGTSCQAAGLKAVLESKNINSKELLMIDFFCHGVPSPKIWRDYLNFYEEKEHRKPLSYRFRSKKYGWGNSSRGSNHLNCVIYQDNFGGVKRDNVSYASRMWRGIFFSNLCIRQYCHHCPYASIRKPADITMGDFWGIEKKYSEFDDGKGSSLAIVRSEKAMKILNEISWLAVNEIPLQDAIEKQTNAFHPSPKNERRAEFWDDYGTKEFPFLAKKYFGYTTIIRTKAFVRRILFALKLMDIY